MQILTRSERRRANKEGWDVFETTVNAQGNWPYQVQRLEGDENAHLILIEGVKQGSTLHRKVLRFLRQNSKPELCNILAPTMTTEQCQLTHDKQLDQLEIAVFGEVVSRV